MKYTWEAVLECDDDDGNHTSYAARTGIKEYPWFWLDQNYDGSWQVETARRYDDGLGDMQTLMVCKTLTSAKRWVTQNGSFKLAHYLDY